MNAKRRSEKKHGFETIAHPVATNEYGLLHGCPKAIVTCACLSPQIGYSAQSARQGVYHTRLHTQSTYMLSSWAECSSPTLAGTSRRSSAVTSCQKSRRLAQEKRRRQRKAHLHGGRMAGLYTKMRPSCLGRSRSFSQNAASAEDRIGKLRCRGRWLPTLRLLARCLP